MPYHQLTDTQNAEILAQFADGKFLYLADTAKWVHYDGTKWTSIGAELKLQALARRVSQHWLDIAANLPSWDDAQYGDIITWATASANLPRITAMMNLVRSAASGALIADSTDFDAQPTQLNTPTGVVDLHTGHIQTHTPDQRDTRITATTPQTNDDSSTWQDFLHTTFNHDMELITYMHHLLGYWATGHTHEHLLWLLVGDNNTNKDAFLTAIEQALGSYTTRANASILRQTQRNNQNASTTRIARLSGIRLAITSGTPTDIKLAKPLITTPKIAIASNSKPTISAEPDVWKHIRVIEFPQGSQSGNEDILQSLRQVAPSILAWIIQGAQLYLQHGLAPQPQCITEATDACQSQGDNIAEWIKERTRSSFEVNTPTAELYRDYRKWVLDAGEHPVNKVRFVEALETAGFPAIKGTGGARCRKGIRLAHPDEPTPEEALEIFLDAIGPECDDNGLSEEDDEPIPPEVLHRLNQYLENLNSNNP